MLKSVISSGWWEASLTLRPLVGMRRKFLLVIFNQLVKYRLRTGTMRRAPSPEMLDLIFAALADETRRGLLSRLSDGEATVGELAGPLHMSLPAVSKHLRVLEEAGLLNRRIEGRSHFISANPKPLKAAVDWIERHRQFWEGSLDRLAALVEKPTSSPQRKPTSTP